MAAECVPSVLWKKKAFVSIAVLLTIITSGKSLPFRDLCNTPLGMSNFQIPSHNLHASRDTAYWERWNARINDNVSGWCVGYSTDREWYQITLDAEHYITAVANQGTHRGFVYEFSLAFSRGLGWFDYKENGTIKKFRRNILDFFRTVSIHNLSFPVRATVIRIYPKRAIDDVCMRLEIYGCLACLDSFGIGERIISDKAMISSTTMGVGFEPFHGRLRGMSGNGSWCGKSSDLDPYLQIDLGDRFQVSMIAIQGNELYEWVQEICRAESNQSSLLSSTENITVGNNSVGNNFFINATMASNSSGNITLTNVTLANNSSGNITITDATLANNSSGNITITNIAVGQNSSTDALNVTEFNTNTSNATLNEVESPPCQEILEIRRRAFVEMFKLSYSDNSEQWSYYHEGGKVKEFEGSTDTFTIEVRSLELTARYIRIHPVTYKFRPCLRVEIYGCKECTDALGAGSGHLPNKAMTASTFLGPGYQPWLARLFNPDGAWCSVTNDEHQFLQIQFAQIRLIRELRIQGSVAKKAWVKAYKLEYSEYGETWATYDNLGQALPMRYAISSIDGKHKWSKSHSFHKFCAKGRNDILQRMNFEGF